jgi:VWFA-related protein
MRNRGLLMRAAFLVAALLTHELIAQGQQAQSNGPTLQVTSALVFLDTTVLDKNGQPVVTGLTKDDFTITEDGKPQRIFSFEAPQMHISGVRRGGDNPEGKPPLTIFVLDLLNSNFQDFAYIRYSFRKYLMAQPEQLKSPAELMVIGNESLEMLQGYTRNRGDLLNALDHLPAALPYKRTNATFFWERFGQSIDALQQIALQNKGVPGRKNIVWMGHGGPNVYLEPIDLPGNLVDELKQYVHSTANMLVNSRISLFVVYPDLPVYGKAMPFSAMQSDIDIGDDDPFAGDINFGVLVNETGGKLFFDRNDVDAEIQRSEQMGAEYYTLTYQPQDVVPDGKFRRIRVTLRDRNLRAVTKAGYFAPDNHAPANPQQRKMTTIAEALQSTIPFSSLNVSLLGVVRHPDSGTAEFTVRLNSKNLAFLPTEDDRNTANLIVAAASLDDQRTILASKIEQLKLSAPPDGLGHLPEVASQFQFSLQFPRNAKIVRVAVANEESQRIGTAELDRRTIDAAPIAPTREP